MAHLVAQNVVQFEHIIEPVVKPPTRWLKLSQFGGPSSAYSSGSWRVGEPMAGAQIAHVFEPRFRVYKYYPLSPSLCKREGERGE